MRIRDQNCAGRARRNAKDRAARLRQGPAHQTRDSSAPNSSPGTRTYSLNGVTSEKLRGVNGRGAGETASQGACRAPGGRDERYFSACIGRYLDPGTTTAAKGTAYWDSSLWHVRELARYDARSSLCHRDATAHHGCGAHRKTVAGNSSDDRLFECRHCDRCLFSASPFGDSRLKRRSRHSAALERLSRD